MDDREKVIKGLECCAQMAGEMCRKCPYANECETGDSLLAGAAHLAADALSLLKRQEPGWISVKDRMPEYDKEVLIYAVSKTTNESKIAISYLMDKFYFGSRPINLKEPIWHEPWQYFGANNTITHWMPLPEPPKKETK